MLYGGVQPSSAPVTGIYPTKDERNQAIFDRHQAGESPAMLAREYGLSEQRVYVTIRRHRKKVD